VQNGADEHGPDRGDIAVEWADFGRLRTHFETHVPCALGGILDKMNYSVDPGKATSPVPRG
jgi:hypothetical protein